MIDTEIEELTRSNKYHEGINFTFKRDANGEIYRCWYDREAGGLIGCKEKDLQRWKVIMEFGIRYGYSPTHGNFT